MEYPLTIRRRHPRTPTSPSPTPRLLRSRSEAEKNSTSLNTSQRLTNRSKSTTKSRNENILINPSNISTTLSSMKQNIQPTQENSGSKDGFVRFLQRGSYPRTSTATKGPKSSSGSSPSAWALSPGRSNFLNVVAVESSPGIGGEKEKVKGESGGGRRGGMSGVLKYFRQKKVSPMAEEEYHMFRVLYNRLLQWRFANARAEAAMATMNRVAEDKLFHVWLRIFSMRKFIVEKQIQIQKLKHEVKLFRIIIPQMILLNEWAKIERKNSEAVGRLTRKLSALSLKLPLEEDAEGQVESLHEAMEMAVGVMDGIKTTADRFLLQVEKILYLLTEFTSMLEHQKESLEEMERIVIFINQLLIREKSVRVHTVQVVKELRENNVTENLE